MDRVKQNSAFEHAQNLRWMDSYNPTHAQSLIRVFARHLNIL